MQSRIDFIKTHFVNIFDFIKFVPMTKKLLHEKNRFCQNVACKNQFYQVKFLENWLKVVKTEENNGFCLIITLYDQFCQKIDFINIFSLPKTKLILDCIIIQ